MLDNMLKTPKINQIVVQESNDFSPFLGIHPVPDVCPIIPIIRIVPVVKQIARPKPIQLSVSPTQQSTSSSPPSRMFVMWQIFLKVVFIVWLSRKC
jgi:hypothetical protein